MKRTIIAILIGYLFLFNPFASADPEALQDAWPLIKGTKWIYEGNITYVVPHDPKTSVSIEKTETIRLSSEVKDVFTNDSYTTAWMHGSIEDFCWYTPNQKPKDWLLLKLGTDYYTLPTKDVPGTFAKLKAAGYDIHTVYEDLNMAKLYLPIPLAIDKRFLDGDDGGVASLVRHRYCWEVDSAHPFNARGVKGLPTFQRTSYSISYRTNPDYTEESFVPGIGMVELHYHHNGTPMDVDAKLVEVDHLRMKTGILTNGFPLSR